MEKLKVIVHALVVVLVLTGVALADTVAGSYEVPWDAYSSGGEQMASESYVMVSTAGQELVGDTTSDGYQLAAGFWLAIESGRHTVYLPLVLRNY